MSTAVFGAPEWRARSGRTVKQREDGTLVIGTLDGYLSPEAVMDVEEWAQAKRDAELGRWRVPTQPDIVVYPVEDGNKVRVFSEEECYLSHVITRDEATAEFDPTSAMGNARAYFDAHPEQKLPEENGVYVPASADLGSGPLTFVLYGGSWRATPGSDDAAELASEWHTRVGLVRLGKPVDAS